MSKPDVQSVFGKELSIIEHAPIRNFVVTAFNQNCPGYFWYIPASVKGHHPPICRQIGGLVHHTKLAVEFAAAFNEMKERDVSTVTEDMVIAAVMLHDMMKRGDTDDELDTFPGGHREALGNHGRYCANQLEYLEDSLPGFGFCILQAVALHMGRWTGDVQKWELQRLEDDEVVRGCHLADYAASRALHNFLGARASDPGMTYLQRATESPKDITCVQCGAMITRVEFYVAGCPTCGE